MVRVDSAGPTSRSARCPGGCRPTPWSHPGSTDAAGGRPARPPGPRRAPSARRAGHARGRSAAGRSWSSGAGPDAYRRPARRGSHARGWSQPGGGGGDRRCCGRQGGTGDRRGIGLDIGATKTLGRRCVDADGRILAQVREADRARRRRRGPHRRARRRGTSAPRPDGSRRRTSVGLGIPGLVDVERGAVKHAVNLGVDGDWLPLRAELLADRLGVPVVVENDVNVATLGAVALSGDPTTSSTSASAPAWPPGWCSTAGCAAATTAPPARSATCRSTRPARVCQCGQRGCLETVASGLGAGRGLAVRATYRPPRRSSRPRRPETRAADRGPRPVRGRRGRARSGCSASPSTRRTIVLGGGVAQLGEPLLEAVSDALRRQAATRRSWPRSTWRPDPGGARRLSGRGRRRGAARPCRRDLPVSTLLVRGGTDVLGQPRDVTIVDGLITDPASRPTPDVVVDADGLVVLPGLVDLQVNGAAGHRPDRRPAPAVGRGGRAAGVRRDRVRADRHHRPTRPPARQPSPCCREGRRPGGREPSRSACTSRGR